MKKSDLFATILSDLEKNSLQFSKILPDQPPPKRKAVEQIINATSALLFGNLMCEGCYGAREREELLCEIFSLANEQIIAAFNYQASLVGERPCLNKSDGERLTAEIISAFPQIHAVLIKDARATYEGDPAATSPAEVILTYPGFYAILVYRLAHEFYIRHIPLIPRLMTESAHQKTGIDIHPGAKIGESFCIDHGTGAVIGETTEIGRRVKIYQGVTLGAKSFEVGDDGNPVKGKKRHPTICQNCIIYAGATILGGDTNIGEGSIIGGNVWLTKSVPPGSKVYYKGY